MTSAFFGVVKRANGIHKTSTLEQMNKNYLATALGGCFDKEIITILGMLLENVISIDKDGRVDMTQH